MTRLLDLGIKHIQQIVMDMSRISGDSVFRSIESYEKNVNVKEESLSGQKFFVQCKMRSLSLLSG
jgi:hypothetical protein